MADATPPSTNRNDRNGTNSHDLPDGAAKDVTDFGSINRRSPREFPPLKIDAHLYSRKYLESPDSEGDILDIVDQSPDVTDEIAADKFTHFGRIFDYFNFSELMPEVYIPNRQVSLKVIDMEPLTSTLNIFNQYLFSITIYHGATHWTIKRKSTQILSLHTQLKLFKTKLKLPATTSEERERRQSMRLQIKKNILELDTERRNLTNPNEGKFVKLPRKALQRMDPTSVKEVESYLSNLLHHSLLRSHCAVLEFFEISPISFINHMGPKLKEDYVKKKSGGVYSLLCCGGRYKTRWLVLRENCLFLISPKRNGMIRCVMLVDSGFQVSHGFRHTGIPKGLLVTNLSRSLVLLCDGDESAKEWRSAIENLSNNFATDFSKPNRYASFAPVRNKSFSRWYVDGSQYMRDVAEALESAKEEIFITDWWLSPDIYMKRPDLTGRHWKLSEILNRQASRGVRIFILVYKEVELALGLNSFYTKKVLSQMNSNIKVLRHPDHYNHNTLYWAHHEKMVIVDQMHAFVGGIDLCYGRWDDYRHKLEDVGHKGVRTTNFPPQSLLGFLVHKTRDIFVSKTDVTESLTDEVLEDIKIQVSKQENIEVMRSVSTLSPKQTTTDEIDRRAVSLVAADELHHDQVLSLNGAVATSKKEIADVESSIESVKSQGQEEKDLLGTSSSITAYEGEPTDDNLMSKIKKKKTLNVIHSNSIPRGENRVSKNLKAVKNLGLDLVEEVRERGKSMRWNTIKAPRMIRAKSFDSEINIRLSSDSDSSESSESKERPRRLHRKIRQKLRRKSKSLSRDLSLDACADSLADIHKDLAHEEATSVHLWIGKDYVNWITRDLHDPHIPFNDTVDRQKTPRMPWHDISLYVEGPAARDAARHFIQRWNAIKSEKVKHNPHYPYLLPKTYEPSSFKPSKLELKHKVSCQVLRSSGYWSAGISEKEGSIYNAYVDAIKNSKHYIYIENQFFITTSNLGNTEVINTIGYHLFDRIHKAFKNKETFRVYVVLPLLPAFEGQLGTPSGVAMQYIVHYIYQSITNGPNSLLGVLNRHNIPWQRYLTFCSLRTHDILENQLVSELIYVHSKLMIVDDRLVIAGSANINDRSLLGERDSEVCLVIEDNEFTKGKMNHQDYDRGQFAGSLRMYLFNEHLGQTNKPIIDVTDPVSDHFYFKIWQTIASINTKLYDEIFNCIPNDSIKTFVELDEFRSKVPLVKKDPEEAKKLISKIQGRLVLYPLLFLKNEDLKPGMGNKEFLLPAQMWT